MSHPRRTPLFVVALVFVIAALACDLGSADRLSRPTAEPTHPPPAQSTPRVTLVPPESPAPRPTLLATATPLRPTIPPAVSVPASPSNLRAIQVTQTEIVVTWQDNSENESGFRVYLAGTDVVARLGSNVTRAVLGNLTCNVQYQYSVRAFNAAGESAPSNGINVTTTKCP